MNIFENIRTIIIEAAKSFGINDKKIHFGDNIGKPVWQEVPGDYRSILRRLIVTQGDTEPASVEQQRLLGKTCPSLFDLRNLFQVNVEEGRHLWAMVYLLQKYFGSEQINKYNFSNLIYDLSSQIDVNENAFEDTINILNNINLLITTDTYSTLLRPNETVSYTNMTLPTKA